MNSSKQEITGEEIQQFLKEMTEVRPELLDKEALKLYNTIMKILDKNDQLESKLKEATTQRNELATTLSEKEDENQKLIEKLEKDIINITKTLQDGKHCDDYSRCRLKAYRTKTKEILEILKGEKK